LAGRPVPMIKDAVLRSFQRMERPNPFDMMSLRFVMNPRWRASA
jgi:hypothetical protein